MTWYYQDRVFTEDMIGDAVAFVYLIENMANNRRYIGKKLFQFSKRKQVKGKKKKYKAKSDWETYYGSNEDLLADVEKHGKIMIRRTILRLCKSKGEASYHEAKAQFAVDAVLDPRYYNHWISVKVRRSHMKGLTYPDNSVNMVE